MHDATRDAYHRYGPRITAAGVALVDKTTAAAGVELIGTDNTVKAIGQLGSTNAAAAVEQLGVAGVAKVRRGSTKLGGGVDASGMHCTVHWQCRLHDDTAKQQVTYCKAGR